MERNLKEILKQKPFKYDEDKQAIKGAFFHVELLKDTEQLIKRLVICGMNSDKGISSVKSSLKTILTAREQLYGDKLVEGTTKANKYLDNYRKSRASIEEQLKKNEELVNRFDEHLQAHLNAIEEQAKTISNPKYILSCEGLSTVGEESIKCIENIKKLTDSALDVTSTESGKIVERIVSLVNEWKEMVTEAIENGKIADKKAVVAPLKEAVKLAAQWAEAKEGVSSANPVSTYRVEIYNTDRDLLCMLLTLDNIAGCEEISRNRNRNNVVIDDICKMLREITSDRYMARISAEDRQTLRELHDKFSKRSALLSRTYEGNYVQARMRGEEALSEFISAEQRNIAKINDAIAYGGCELELVGSVVECVHTCFDAWDQTKSCSWRCRIKPTGANMTARNQMAALFDSTVADLNELISSCADLSSDDNRKITDFASKAVSKLEELKGSITTNGFVDTVENIAAVDAVRGSLGELRTKMFAISATDKTIDNLLSTLERGVVQLQESDIRGKSARKIEVHSFGDDDLVCAVKVTGWLNESSSFINNLKSIMNDRSTFKRMSLIKLSDDEEYISLSEQIKECEDLAANAETDEEADMYMVQLEELEGFRNKRVEQIKEKNEEIRDEFSDNQGSRKTGYEKVLKLLQSIYSQFTGRNLVSYKKRAEILERSNIGSFDEIFEKLTNARAEGDATAILMIEGKLNIIIEEYQKSRSSIEDAERIIDRTKAEEKAKEDAAKARADKIKGEKFGVTEDPAIAKAEADKQARAERLAALRAKRGVEAPVKQQETVEEKAAPKEEVLEEKAMTKKPSFDEKELLNAMRMNKERR